MQQRDAPLCSRLFLLFHWAKGTEQPPRTANAASFEAEEEEKSLGATQKNLPDIRLLPKGALKCFQAGDWIEGWNCVPRRSKPALDETWAMLQHCKVLKRQCYIYIGWRNINGLEDFCHPKNNGKFGGQSGIFKPAPHSAFPKLSVQPRQNTNILLQIYSPLPMNKNHTSKATLQNYSFSFLFFLQLQCHTVNE